MAEADRPVADAVGKAGERRGERRLHGEDHLCLLPPSANWYCSKICDCGRSDVFGLLLAFGAKNSVFIYQVTSASEAQDASGVKTAGSGVKLSFFAQLVRGKRDRRVTAVQFLTDTTGELRLVCGGEEGSVQIWDVASLTLIEQHRKHKAEVMAVTVSSTLDANFVLAGDRQGRISAWERDAGKVFVFTPVSGDAIHSIAISPHDKALVAVGYRSGVLCLVDAARGTVRHRLNGHDQEVQCVAWKSTCEASRSAIEDETSSIDLDRAGPEEWLASSSRDKTIKVWKIAMNTAEEPALEQVLRLPTGKQGMSFTQTKQLWLPVAWSTNSPEAPGKHCLWSGSFDGSLFRWEWNAAMAEDQAKKGKSRRTSCKPVVVKGGHSRMLFTIVGIPPCSSALVEGEPASMLTVSLDRELRLWKENPLSKSAPAATCVEKLTGLGGHAYSTSYSSTNKLLAAGIGDQTIRLWNLAAGTSDYECDLLWRGLQSKVTCVQWHPFHHSLLAYGMEDGRIGVYDVQTKKYNHFRSGHDHEIKQLQWIVSHAKQPDDAVGGDTSFLESVKQLEAAQAQGQTLDEVLVVQEGQTAKNRDGDDVKVALWSRDAGGHILESNADAIDKNSRKIMNDCAAFALDDKSGLLAIGLSNGVVKVMNWDDNSVEANRFHEHSESITCLAWTKGPNAGLLASGGQDGKIFVYGTKSTAMDADGNSTPNSQKLHLLGSMEAHSNTVTGLRWCTDASSGLLASSSADGSVQVWNAASLEREAYFKHHVGRVLSLDWVSQYTLVTGGEDQTLRFWDCREQQKGPQTNQKKTCKVKQPQEVGITFIAGESREGHMKTQKEEVANPDKLANASSTDDSISTKNKSRKKSVMIFHPEVKLSPAEIASACNRTTGVKCAEADAENVDGVKTNQWKNNMLVHTDRASIRAFFASEEKRYQDEQDWESLANMLLIQGNVTDALRIVAKEGALSPTWLSYAPMGGMDLWREMTNLYARQLDAQGDKKTAGSLLSAFLLCCLLVSDFACPLSMRSGPAIHFLSIAKVRSAITCLVSGDAHREALALIRSRLGPHDPLLHDTLWKYAEFLLKRGHHGEAALVFLQVGSIKAKTRAVHTLANTGDMILINSALEVLLSDVKSPVGASCTDDADFDNSTAEFSFPASFFISIAGRALTKLHFDVAETAGRLLQSRLVATSSLALYRLTSCLLKILKAINEHQPGNFELGEANRETKAFDKLLQSDAPCSVRELFDFFTKPHGNKEEYGAERLDDRVLSGYATAIHAEEQLSKQRVAHRGAHFWCQVLSAYQECGYWFDAGGQARIQEAQNLLVESNCFGDIEKAVANDSAITPLLEAAQRLLRFVMDVMSSSFIGALEHMREACLLLAQGEVRKSVGLPFSGSEGGVGDFQLAVMLLLFPLGFASPKELPQCGELADEQLDTLVLWSSVLLSQCKILLAAFVKNGSTLENVQLFESFLRSLLQLLRVEFLNAKATFPLNQGLMDPANQSQLQTLLNDILVIAHQLPDCQEKSVDSCANNVSDQGEENKESLSLKQTLIVDVNDVRSRLTWSADGVK